MIDGIFLQGKALLTKEILQNDDKKQRYGNGSEPFIQAVASRYCFASPCDGEAGGCGRSSTVKVQTSETGDFPASGRISPGDRSRELPIIPSLIRRLLQTLSAAILQAVSNMPVNGVHCRAPCQ